MTVAVAVVIGVLAGMLGGMLGVGGGTIAVPAMVLLLGTAQITAQGVSLVAILLTALVGAFVHYRQGNVKLSVALWVAPSAAAFSLLGAWAAGVVSAEWLTRAFAIFLLLIGFRMLLSSRGGQSASAS